MAEVNTSTRLRPSFLIIGAQRSGTTSLYRYLTEHPSIAPAAKKEVHFFDVHYEEGLGWYEAQFPSAEAVNGEGVISGEASPYYLFHPLAASRAAATLPEVKLIAILRNPVDRALSHHQHETRRGKEILPIEAALDSEVGRLRGEEDRLLHERGYRSHTHQWHSYRARGCYMDQIEVWLEKFRREQLLVLISEDFYADPSRALQEVTNFLGLPALPKREPTDFEKFNHADYSQMPAKVRAQLVEFFRPHNRRLAAFLGRNPGWDISR